jgi:hypothetical protein
VAFSEYKNFIFHISKSFSSWFPIEAQFVAKTFSNSIQIVEKLVIKLDLSRQNNLKKAKYLV